MRLSLVFYAFLVRMAVGTLLSLTPLWRMRAAERHVRFQLVLAACLVGAAAALYLPGLAASDAGGPGGAQAFLSLEGAIPGAALLLIPLCLAANYLFGTYRRRAGRAVTGVALLVGAVAVLGTVRLGVGGAPTDAAALGVLTLSALLGGFLIGAIHNAMILGHFYLMIRGLPLEALKHAGRTVGVVLGAKAVLFTLVLVGWDGASDVLLGPELVWTCWRVMFGFVGPLVLLFMVKDTVRLKHTQAATGLLYVAVAFGLMGELAAVYLELATGLPA